MFSYIGENLYYYLGYEEDIEPDPKVLRIRDEMLKQIRLSKIKLNTTYTKQSPHQIKPVKYNSLVKSKKNKRRRNHSNKKD